jgi:hypothetical protein
MTISELTTIVIAICSALGILIGSVGGVLAFFIKRDIAHVSGDMKEMKDVREEWLKMSGHLQLLAEKLAPTLEEVSAIRASQKRSWEMLTEHKDSLEEHTVRLNALEKRERA